MEPEPANADEKFGYLALTDAITEKTESIAVFNLSVSLTGLVIGGLALLGQWVGGTSEYSALLISAMIASGGWFVGSVGDFVEYESHFNPIEGMDHGTC